MKQSCDYHPTRIAHWICSGCSAKLCPECVVKRDKGGFSQGEFLHFCPKCNAPAEWCGVEVNRACSMGIRAGGYHWERVGEQSPMVKIVPPRDRETGYAKRRRPILCVDTGEVFECAREVCEVLGTTNISTIHNAAAGRSKTAHGYRWAYA
jgi:hypothetical protein